MTFVEACKKADFTDDFPRYLEPHKQVYVEFHGLHMRFVCEDGLESGPRAMEALPAAEYLQRAFSSDRWVVF